MEEIKYDVENVFSAFDGMSCGQIALNKIGIKYKNYYASEIDKCAMQVTQHNYSNTIQLGDITKINICDLPKIDLLIGGSPCQSFSNSGNRKGFDGKSGLFFEYVRLLKELKPKYFLLENVVMKKVWQDIISKELDVEPIKINSNLVSAQNRPRLYWTNIPNISQPLDKKIKLVDILENVIFDKEPYNEKYRSNIAVNYKNSKFNTLRANAGSKTRGIGICDDNEYWRKLTPIECERLQCVPDNYTNIVSDTQRYKMLGNGWTVDVIAHIFKNIKNK